MSKIGFLFPGQGAQFVGMGKSVYEQSPKARGLYQQAKQILEWDITAICFEGPEELLTQTKYSQPAIFVTSLAVLECLKEKYPALHADAALGLSLGEYTALVALNSLEFSEGLRLVQARGEAMEIAAKQSQGTMASVLGMDYATCQSVCESLQGVQVANLNTPEQIVISGTIPGVEAAMVKLKEKGAKKIIPLKVSGAFHSHLMAPAADSLSAAVKAAPVAKPQGIFLPNFTAKPEQNPETIKDNLLSQLTGTVRWSESFDYCVKNGMQRFLEIGPGTVLKGLARKINNTAEVFSVEKFEEIENLASSLFIS